MRSLTHLFCTNRCHRVTADDDFCGHCGRLLVGLQCRVHGTPETTVGFEDAWRIEQEERSGYDG